MKPSIIIQLDDPAKHFSPGDEITGTFRFIHVQPEELRRMEFSVLWFTEGKGDEDMGVHHFESISWGAEQESLSHDAGKEIVLAGSAGLTEYIAKGSSRMYSYSVRLPASPLSYYGLILKIRWCIRVRIFLTSGREVMEQKLFLLGNLPPVEVLLG
ncbi:MAG: hypothetical protein Q4C96_04935 [Planctomycetia bacterium]|nr:hypothetical protein [Planctomycetia bacterium]